LPAGFLAELLPDLKTTGVPELDGMVFPDLSIAALKQMFPERLLRQIDNAQIPTFEQFAAQLGFMNLKEESVLTRVERVIPADRVPEQLKVLKSFKKELPSLNPFERLVIERGSWLPEPVIPKNIKARDYLVILGFQRLMQEHMNDLTWARRELNKRSRNAEKLIAKYIKFLPAATDSEGLAVGVTENQLLEMYQDSITRQLAA
jgi:hypothetical protein